MEEDLTSYTSWGGINPALLHITGTPPHTAGKGDGGLEMSWICPWEVSPLKQSLSHIYTPFQEGKMREY